MFSHARACVCALPSRCNPLGWGETVSLQCWRRWWAEREPAHSQWCSRREAGEIRRCWKVCFNHRAAALLTAPERAGCTSSFCLHMPGSALCSALISSEGPVMRLVPVSTMAWQLGLQRLSWSPTLILYKETQSCFSWLPKQTEWSRKCVNKL